MIPYRAGDAFLNKSTLGSVTNGLEAPYDCGDLVI
jgi:hypothetical protein